MFAQIETASMATMSNIKSLIPLLLLPMMLLCTQRASAVPACPAPATVIQPDGRAIQVYLRGDEFYHWNEDQRGFTVVKEPQSGRWVYAVLDAQGNLARSELVVGKDNPAQSGLAPRLRPVGFHSRAKATAQGRLLSGAVAQKGPQRTPTTGTMKNLVVLVAFADKPSAYTRTQFEALFNTIGYSFDSAQGSVKDYYNEVSYNQLNVDSVVAEWVTLSRGYAYYGANDMYGNDAHPREMVQEALAALEVRGFDFSTLDSDGDGWVDGLTVIHSGGGEEYSGNDDNYIWSHQWSLSSTLVYDGKRMQTYHTEPERRGWDSSPGTYGMTRIGVICHENGHFLELPDLYDYGYDSEGAGNFCLMAGGSWNGNYGTQPAQMSAWCKKDLNWLTPTVVTTSGTYTVSRVEDNQTVYRLSGNFPSTQYFLIENRQGYGFDASLPGSTRGLLVWHVDETVDDNDNQLHYKVDLEEASGTQHLELNENSGNDADYFRYGTMTTFNNDTAPNNRSYAGTALDQDITAVSASSTSMTFTVATLPAPIPAIPGAFNDYDGDGKTDYSFYGWMDGKWYIWSSYYHRYLFYGTKWGDDGYIPVSGDFDGDGIADIAVYSENSKYWYIYFTGTGLYSTLQWGGPGFKPACGDYDGDGKTDYALYYSPGGNWYIWSSLYHRYLFYGTKWGGNGYIPAAGDFDGDGIADIAVYSENSKYWYVYFTGTGLYSTLQWGGPGFKPACGDYDGDGKTDYALYYSPGGNWYIWSSLYHRYLFYGAKWGGDGYIPVAGDFDGDGKADIAVYSEDSKYWYVYFTGTGLYSTLQWGESEYRPPYDWIWYN
ncbi:MAG: M6 family metalloprotease domain-containing protein [Kiritimatiellae bacterium]|nr:M6 family metalloprotease domain-containing protein [Kiritimatiellia bacterium]